MTTLREPIFFLQYNIVRMTSFQIEERKTPVTSIEDFTSQYGLVQKIDAFGYLDYLKNNPDAPRKHGKVVLVTADTPLKASRGEGKTTTTIALIDALRERGIDAAAVLRQPRSMP